MHHERTLLIFGNYLTLSLKIVLEIKLSYQKTFEYEQKFKKKLLPSHATMHRERTLFISGNYLTLALLKPRLKTGKTGY